MRYRGVIRPKVKYRTVADAEGFLFKYVDRNPNDETSYRLGVYECRHCGWYHIGHSRTYDNRTYRKMRVEETLVGKLIAALKHVINGDPMPRGHRST